MWLERKDFVAGISQWRKPQALLCIVEIDKDAFRKQVPIAGVDASLDESQPGPGSRWYARDLVRTYTVDVFDGKENSAFITVGVDVAESQQYDLICRLSIIDVMPVQFLSYVEGPKATNWSICLRDPRGFFSRVRGVSTLAEANDLASWLSRRFGREYLIRASEAVADWIVVEREGRILARYTSLNAALRIACEMNRPELFVRGASGSNDCFTIRDGRLSEPLE